MAFGVVGLDVDVDVPVNDVAFGVVEFGDVGFVSSFMFGSFARWRRLIDVDTIVKPIAAGDGGHADVWCVCQPTQPGSQVRRGRYDASMSSSVRTLLFSDVEGSTELLHRADDYAGLLQRHRETVRSAVRSAGGTEQGTEGDSFVVTFDSPSDALSAAVQAQLPDFSGLVVEASHESFGGVVIESMKERR